MGRPSKTTSTPEPDLFSLSAGDESGYAKWRAEAEAGRSAEKSENAVELPVGADTTGYDRWHREAEEARREFGQRWGVPLGRRVRVALLGEDTALEGLLREVEEDTRSRKRGIWLQMGDRAFHSSLIDSVVRIEES